MRNQKPNLSRSKTQAGVTIISLMVGLLVSAITVVSTLSVYRNLTQISVDSTFDSKAMGDFANAALRIQLEVQSAGFGLDAPAASENNHLVVIPKSTGASPKPHSIVWRRKVTIGSPDIECVRIAEREAEADEIPNNEGNLTAKTLVLQTITGAPCDAITNLANISETQWKDDATTQVISMTVMTRLDTEFTRVAQDIDLFSFQLESQSCAPFGMIESKNRTQVEVSHTDVAEINLRGASSVKDHIYKLCIANVARAEDLPSPTSSTPATTPATTPVTTPATTPTT